MKIKNTTKNNIPTIFVIYGATGDLVSKKIVPALFDLYQTHKLPKLLKVIGYSRRDLGDNGFKDHVERIISELYNKNEIKPSHKLIQEFLSIFSYQQGYFDEEKGYKSLAKTLGMIDGEWKVCSNKLFYLAVPPENYKTILNNLAKYKLTEPCGPDEGWTRVLVEKPFGKDLETAKQLDELLGKLFNEEQIYRIDHYLAKEMLLNILSFRFNNRIFESSWNSNNIKQIDIKLWEKLGVENRGDFYDGVGALRDMGQNHALQMLALVTMDNPGELNSQNIRNARINVFNEIKKLSDDDIRINTFRAQYEGYKDITGVVKNSKTETYFNINLTLDTPRWEGVPIFVEIGKKMKDVKKEVIVTFKNPSNPIIESDNLELENKVIFSFDSDERIKINFISKKPGLDFDVESTSLDFTYRDSTNKKLEAEEYEKLLLDVFAGDQTLFVSTQEIRAMWAIVDPIINGWNKNLVPLATYKTNTNEAAIKAQEKFKSNKKITIKKTIGIIGMGKMGGNIAKRLAERGWQVTGYQRNQDELKAFAEYGITPASSIRDLVSRLQKPRLVLLMLPAGEVTHTVLTAKDGLISLLNEGDYIIDGSNNFYEDTQSHYKFFKQKNINFIDMGISGGPGGARNGACLMIGGHEYNFKYLKTLFEDMSLDGNAYEFFSGEGAGHFVKMVHNGIEYGMMQSIGEGFNLLKQVPFNLDVQKVANIYQKGSVIESRLVGWLLSGYKHYGTDLGIISGAVEQNGEGLWTVTTAEKMNVKVDSIKLAVDFRVQSQNNPSYTGQVLSVLRTEFGGHKVIK